MTFTEAQNTRLHGIVKRDGQPGGVAGFLFAAAMRAMDEADRKHRERTALVEDTPQQRGPRGINFNQNTPQSTQRGMKFDLGEPLRAEEPPESPPPPPPPPPQVPVTQVVVNQGGSASQTENELTRLARFIAAAPTSIERDRRTITANSILKASAQSREEELALAKKLDEEIKKVTGAGDQPQKPKSALDMIGDWFLK